MNSDDPLDEGKPLDEQARDLEEQARVIAENLWLSGHTDFAVAVAAGATSSTATSPDHLYELLEPDAGDLYNWFCVIDD